MAKDWSFLFCYFCSILIFTVGLCYGGGDEDRQIYIVYMGSLRQSEYSPSSQHLEIMSKVFEGSSSNVRDHLIRSYKRSFNGFAAKLTRQEQQQLASMKEVVSVFPSSTFKLHTTRSWDFVGLGISAKRNPTAESDIIIGIIDSGIWHESESFNDEGLGPVPKKWKGVCKGGQNFTCNRKLIGARYYATFSREETAGDDVGHGTHTASTVAGRYVKDVSHYGLAKGTARGGVPSARIAMYKACHADSGCQSVDILAAFDDAIADGVDVLSVSLGPGAAVEYTDDSVAIGAFHAMQRGVFTAQAAGNDGPALGTASSVAPWLLSVAASSTDRRIIDKVVLGNGKTLVGNSINPFTLNGTELPLVYGKPLTICDESSARICLDGCLDEKSVKNKILFCDSSQGDSEALRTGALGVINYSPYDDVSAVVSLPTSALVTKNLDVVKSYLNSTKSPQANIFRSEVIKDSAAPLVPSFSSRGPNLLQPDILKPDISAPGVEILAAFSPQGSPTEDPADKRSLKYNILSGTSMACPHAAAAAAYVKLFHPDWSPSAIKSALMTTAWPMNHVKNPDGEFAFGSGNIDPVKATDPGLVYDASTEDYIKFLCSVGYDGNTLKGILGDNSTCPKDKAKLSPRDLNYPSISAGIPATKSFKIQFIRTVTNVGAANSTYKAEVVSSSMIRVWLEPSTLSFKSLNEKKSFVVSVAGGGLVAGSRVSASLVWSDGTHRVRSPIIVHNSTTS